MNDVVLDKKPQGGDDQGDDKHGPNLHFEHVASVQTVKVRVAWTDTLQTAWNEAYEELGEDRRADDRLQTDGGVDMTPYLGSTMRQLFDDKRTKSHKFVIVGPTGGAQP